MVGIVEAIGDGVTDVSVDDEVIGHIVFEAPFEAGTLAEYAVVSASSVALKPSSLDHTTAAALPLAGGAALAAVEAANVHSGQTVLVNGASGGVGRYAVQLAAQRGATVVATGSAADRDRLRELGASEVVDHTAGPVTAQVRTLYPDGVDVLVNLWGDTVDDVPLDAVRPDGTVSTIKPVPDVETTASHGLRGGGITIATPNRETIASLARSAAAATLQVDIYRVVSLNEAIEALDEISAGKARGKIIVDLR